jgi:ABC-2 type transport system ATP-binding protein
VKAYRGRRVVDGLSLTAAAGAVTAVLGPNGAGKTTTVECCAGLRSPDAGAVRVLGLDRGRHAAVLRARVGVMLQDGGLPNGARAGEVLRHVAALHERPLPVAALLDELGLADHAGTTVRRLSGGQRRRLALACAVVGRPELVFLDEPSAGLDPQSRLAAWGLVERLRDAGAAIVLTTHLMEEAERLADLVVVVDAGRVVAEGSPRALVSGRAGTDGRGPGTDGRGPGGDALRFAARPGIDLSGLRAAVPAGTCVEEPLPGRYVVQLTDGAPLGPQVLATVTAWCASQDVMPEGLTLGTRTLEDVFLDLTGRALR